MIKSGKIYAIQNTDRLSIYIGSTRTPLRTRLAQHRAQYKFYTKGNFHYLTSFDIMKGNNPFIMLVEDLGNCTNEQLLQKEGDYINIYNQLCVNNKKPTGKQMKQNKKPSLAPLLSEFII